MDLLDLVDLGRRAARRVLSALVRSRPAPALVAGPARPRPVARPLVGDMADADVTLFCTSNGAMAGRWGRVEVWLLKAGIGWRWSVHRGDASEAGWRPTRELAQAEMHQARDRLEHMEVV